MGDFALCFYRDLINEVKEIVAIDMVYVTDYIFRLVYSNSTTLKLMYNLKIYHEESYRHSIRACIYSVIVSKEVISDNILNIDVCLASLLHDIGKLKIPLDILNKDGRLNEIELDIIRTHIGHSNDILLSLNYNDYIRWLVMNHHELPNATGYPRGIVNNKICTQVIAICDMFDALTSKRVYKEAFSVDNSLELIEREGFTPYLIQILAERSKKE